MYQEFGYVWWADSSVRSIEIDFKLPLKYLKENNILFFTYDISNNIALHTHTTMFAYFSEDPCLYKSFGEVEAGSIAFRKSNVTDVVLRQWVSCALIFDCIAPSNATKHCGKPLNGKMTDAMIGHCHRFDQSALSIILRRLYHKQNDYPMVEIPFTLTEVRRRHDIPYFV